MADYLRDLPVQAVAAWYRRLADAAGRGRVEGRKPYAAMFLRCWLDNRNPRGKFTFRPRPYLANDHRVVAAPRFHRAVFLSQQPARLGRPGLLGSRTKLVGAVPRIKAEPGFPRWNLPGETTMEYQSLVEIGTGPLDILRIQNSGAATEQDLFGSLRGFQLRSRIRVSGVRTGKQVVVRFIAWRCAAVDRYDWNYSEYLTVKNPDFRSKERFAVRPGDEEITVYHSNAKRLEDAGLAAPYDVESDPWAVLSPSLIGPATVTA